MDTLEYQNTQETKVHGHEDFPFNIYLCSIPLDFHLVPTHWHNDMEIIYIKKGRGIVSIDLRPSAVAQGDIVIVPPGRLHSIGQFGQHSMEYENIIFQLDMLFPRQEDLCVSEYFLPLLQRQLEIPVFLCSGLEFYEAAAACLDEADNLCSLRPPAYELSVKAQLFQFFYILFSHGTPVPKPAPPLKNRSIHKAKLIFQYIENHYAENLTIKEMAETCGFSQSHFMKFFKSSFGTSFVSYLKEYRLTKAARLLVSSSGSVLTIAQETGFDNLSYFNRSFKKMYGVTPRQFRDGG